MSDDEAPSTFWRSIRSPEFWLLFVCGGAALMGAPWWLTVPGAVAGLSISSLPKLIEMWPRARAVGAELEWAKVVALSILNSVGAAVAAHVAGILSKLLWGLP